MSPRRQPALPPRLNGFEYVGLLGMGGFADVFEYRQDFPRRSVAVKVLLDSSLDAGSRDGFFAEANIMAGLSQHPSIVTIHQAAIASDGRPYFVMEYCSRPSLGSRFRNERISVAETLRTGIRVASAVETAHRLGVLHRDIKPANILATDFGWPALTDFGIAGTLGDQMVSAGMSIPWAPPELLADEPYGDVRSDVYSLAATLYSMLAGRSPFEVPGRSNSPMDLITRIEREPLRSIDRVDVPQSLNLVLARAMSKSPEQRFSSAVAFAHALQSIEREMQLPVTGIDVTEDVVNLAKHETSRSPQTGPGSSQNIQNNDATRVTSLQPVPSPETDPSDEATRIRAIVAIDPEPVVQDAVVSGVETRLRPVTTIHSEEQRVVEPLEPKPVWSPVAAREGLEQAFEPHEFEEATGNDGYFYGKRQQVDPTPDSGTRRTTWIVSVLSVLALVIVLLYIGSSALKSDPQNPVATPTPSGQPTLGAESVPAVTGLKVTEATQDEVSFVWTNPAPQTGDTYVWRLVDVSDHSQTTRTEESFVTVKRPKADSDVCIEVSLVRSNGKASNTPTRECSG